MDRQDDYGVLLLLTAPVPINILSNSFLPHPPIRTNRLQSFVPRPLTYIKCESYFIPEKAGMLGWTADVLGLAFANRCKNGICRIYSLLSSYALEQSPETSRMEVTDTKHRFVC